MSRYYGDRFVKTKYLRKYTHNPNVDLDKVKLPKNLSKMIKQKLIVNLKSY